MRKSLLYILFIVLMATTTTVSHAQRSVSSAVQDSIKRAIQRITLAEVAGSYVQIESIRVRNRGSERVVEIRASKELSYYPMRLESVERIYSEVRRQLPAEYRNYTILIYTEGELIDRLIPQYYNPNSTSPSYTNTSATPLITRLSALATPDAGLRGRHIALWQSHGRYFNNNTGEWSWQRSRLWETVEDLYTQSYVLPFLVPMLERAGANVLLPRERSTQQTEIIIDNNSGIDPTTYRETRHGNGWSDGGTGFAHLYESYPTGHNPFEDGTIRIAETARSGRNFSTATWSGAIEKSGIYSVYVAYQTLENSVSDARYTVHASGGDRHFSVNQQMGGGMWICLGEFYFEASDERALVTLTNQSNSEGVVVADAVKIGGGMGNIRRGSSPETVDEPHEVSHYPRFTEGARYWLQWSGFEPSVYAPKEGRDDYRDDYMSRAHWVNALLGGSERLPDQEGKAIPVDLAFAFHSDAGVRLNDDIIGTLGIYCTRDNGGEFSDDISRLRSRDLTDIVMTEIVEDIRAKYEPNWTRRGMWDRAYYEARIPNCPTMLLELLSHQNFADMRYGLDPQFRFDVSRAIYKGMLRYIASQYDVEYVVQPLPINSFTAELRGDKAHLSWQPTIDALEPTATPEYYILYTRVDESGFDCGRRVDDTEVEVDIEVGKLYRFRLTAVNRGGESFDSETLAVGRVNRDKGHVMVINGFDRVAAPMSIQGDSIAGFYNLYDSGAAYIEDISFIGEQTIFDRSLSRSENESYALGSCYNDYETEVIAGNSFDYPALHGRAIMEAGFSFSSTSARAVESGQVELTGYDIVDLILGKQRATAHGRGATGYQFEALSEAMQTELRDFTSQGGALLVSGSYILTDLWHSPIATTEDREFAEEVLHVSFGGNMATRRGDVYAPATRLSRRGLTLSFNTELCSDIYCVESPEVVVPVGERAFTALRYRANGKSAAVAYRGDYRSVVVGFPIETITSTEELNTTMSAILKFLNSNR